MKRQEIMLLGPMKVGKSSVASILSEKLKCSHVRVDLLRAEYFFKLGWPTSELEKKRDELSEYEFANFCQSLELPMLKMLTNEHQDCVFDCGGGNAVCKDEKSLLEINKLVGNFPNSFLLLPNPDLTESMLILSRQGFEYKSRNRPFTVSELQLNSDIIKFHLKHQIANHVIYTENKSPSDVVEKIMQSLE